jgi:hypothetical protein
MLTERVPMNRCTVAHVGFPTVVGIPGGETAHEAVSAHLRNNGGARNGMDLGVPLYNSIVLPAKALYWKTVDNHVPRCEAEVSQSALHGSGGRFENVDAIDLMHGRGPKANRERPSMDLLGERFSLGARQRLGIRGALDDDAFPEDHGCCHHRASERTSAYFIDSRYVRNSTAPVGSLVFEIDRVCRRVDRGA